MTLYYHFTKPTFTARTVARTLGKKLGRQLSYQEADEWEELDGVVDITDRIHLQVGADYLVVCAYEDRTTLRSWPARPNIPSAFKDLMEAMRDFPDPSP